MTNVIAYTWDLTQAKPEAGQGSNPGEGGRGEKECNLKQAGIYVFNFLWEFCPEGVVSKRFVDQSAIVSAFKVIGSPLIKHLGTTSVTKDQFRKWVAKSVDRKSLGYDIVTMNSMHWATEATGFLGLEPEPAWTKSLDWISKNTELAKLEYDLVVDAIIAEDLEKIRVHKDDDLKEDRETEQPYFRCIVS